VRLGRQRLQEALRERHPRLRTTHTYGGMSDPDTYEAGKRAGRKVVLHRPLEHGRGSLGRLLT